MFFAAFKIYFSKLDDGALRPSRGMFLVIFKKNPGLPSLCIANAWKMARITRNSVITFIVGYLESELITNDNKLRWGSYFILNSANARIEHGSLLLIGNICKLYI